MEVYFTECVQEELHSYAASICHNGELISSLNSLFEEQPNPEILDPVCHQLFEFYRSSESELQRFALELVPSLLWLYLACVSRGEKSKCGGVEAFLLSVYNLESCNADGTPKVKTSRIPVFSQHSIYHEPQTISCSPLSESALLRFNAEPTVYQDGPHPQYESVNGQNRHSILAYLLQCYHNNISNLSARSYKTFCKMCSRIVTTGFHTLMQVGEDDDDVISTTTNLTEMSQQVSQSGELSPRISVSPALLIDMLSCLYYIMFNGQAGPGAQAIVDIHYRACYELFPDVMLVTNAIRNSLRENPSGQPDDGPIGLSLALSPASSSYTLSKTAITNASFRAKKLPDDIPVQPEESNKLPTISEDDASAKPKISKSKQMKKEKGEKSRTKEKESRNLNNSISSGEMTLDNVQVAHARGSQRSSIDTIELTSFTKGKDGDLNSSPHTTKHSSPNVKSSSGIKTSISNKDIKNTKMSGGHTRTHSGGSSAGSENYSTDL
ncbi:hyccin-like [Mercenaria mercenaria]|uniref:hyccin-like n=1 Tax=Mercenaria mercenaria TaxID=6596 RepID=UPI00234EB2F9|nr:hyccin-like [Mercenaria mercenaria]